MWARPLADGSLAVALFNAGNNTANITASFDTLPAPADPVPKASIVGGHYRSGPKWIASTKAVPRDLWTHTDLGEVAGEFSASVEAHGTVVVKLTKI